MARAQCLFWWTTDDELLRRLSNGLQGLRRVEHHHVRVGAAIRIQFRRLQLGLHSFCRTKHSHSKRHGRNADDGGTWTMDSSAA